MDGRDSIPSLLVLRKLTRAITDAVRAQMTEYLATLAPLLQPKIVLGDYIQGGSKESTRKADKAFKELQTLYEKVAGTKPFNLARELTPPLTFSGVGLEITAVDYPHTVQSGSDTRTIMVRSPLTWVLTYAGFAPSRLPDLLKAKLRPGDELERFVLSYLLMHVVTTSSRGLMHTFDALHFPITTSTSPEFGALPITRIGVGISTARPSDAVILESAELTGMDAFEEVVNVADLSTLRDPLKERLLEIGRQQAPELVSS
ncbi:MAG: hypothetical protein GEU99_26580 [Luteitalea sp.]|nr:hypothetical protein [Luteitalea sp.]